MTMRGRDSDRSDIDASDVGFGVSRVGAEACARPRIIHILIKGLPIDSVYGRSVILVLNYMLMMAVVLADGCGTVYVCLSDLSIVASRAVHDRVQVDGQFLFHAIKQQRYETETRHHHSTACVPHNGIQTE